MTYEWQSKTTTVPTQADIDALIASVVRATVREILTAEKKPGFKPPTPPRLEDHIDLDVNTPLQSWHATDEPQELGCYVELNSYAAVLTPDELRTVADVLEAYNATVRAYLKSRG